MVDINLIVAIIGTIVVFIELTALIFMLAKDFLCPFVGKCVCDILGKVWEKYGK